MKQFKRNAVIIVVVLFVCVAAYLNWSYGQETELESRSVGDETYEIDPSLPVDKDTDEDENEDLDSGLYFDGAIDQSGYFAEARLTRQQARDTAVAALGAVNEAEGASQVIIDAALEKIAEIATYVQKEAEIETLIKAKGFTDCVAFVSDEGVKITVPAPSAGLSTVDVAKITEIATSETSFTAENLNIVEVK